jgi:hypothetical protein
LSTGGWWDPLEALAVGVSIFATTNGSTTIFGFLLPGARSFAPLGLPRFLASGSAIVAGISGVFAIVSGVVAIVPGVVAIVSGVVAIIPGVVAIVSAILPILKIFR